jgi:hypothetical protein
MLSFVDSNGALGMGGRGSPEARKRAHAAWVARRQAEGWTQKTVWVPPGYRIEMVDENNKALEEAKAKIEGLERELAKAQAWQERVKQMGFWARVFKRWPPETGKTR